MEGKSGQTARFRVVYKRSSTLTKVLLLAAVVLSTVALLSLGRVIADADAQNQALLGQAAQLEGENAQLEQNIQGLGSVDGAMQIAKDELGLVDPDTVILTPGN